MKRLSATIEEAKLARVTDLFTRRPPTLRIGDTDTVILTLRTEEGKTLKYTFYLRLKADGTFTTIVLNTSTRRRQRRFAKFLTYYGIAKDPERFNVKENLSDLKGKKVEVTTEKYGSIYVPGG